MSTIGAISKLVIKIVDGFRRKKRQKAKWFGNLRMNAAINLDINKQGID